MVTLAAVVLALFPAVAEAQTDETQSTSSVVVQPGDSLWSISQERLGPDATPQQVAESVEQIYALNRERIGADPNLIFVGQVFLVPPAMLSERPTGATMPVRKTTEAAEAGPKDRAVRGSTTTSKAPRTAPGGALTKGGETSKPLAEREAKPATLPSPGPSAPVPAVGAVGSNDAQPSSSVASFFRAARTAFASVASALAGSFLEVSANAPAEVRVLFGWGIMVVVTLVVVSLMARKMPIRRTTPEDAERRGISAGYYGDTPPASRTSPFAYHTGSIGGSLGGLEVGDTRRGTLKALGGGRRLVLTGVAVARNGLALGAHNPKVRRASQRARRLRPLRQASRHLSPLVAVGQPKEARTRRTKGLSK